MKILISFLLIMICAISYSQTVIDTAKTCTPNIELAKKYSESFKKNYLNNSIDNIVDAGLTAQTITNLFKKEFAETGFNDFCAMSAVNFFRSIDKDKVHFGLAVFQFNDETNATMIFNKIKNFKRNYLHLLVATQYKILRVKSSLLIFFSETPNNPKIATFYKTID